jgi:hypothetical protein
MDAGSTGGELRERLEKYRDYSFSERDKGALFERLMLRFLKTYLAYARRFNPSPDRTAPALAAIHCLQVRGNAFLCRFCVPFDNQASQSGAIEK